MLHIVSHNTRNKAKKNLEMFIFKDHLSHLSYDAELLDYTLWYGPVADMREMDMKIDLAELQTYEYVLEHFNYSEKLKHARKGNRLGYVFGRYLASSAVYLMLSELHEKLKLKCDELDYKTIVVEAIRVFDFSIHFSVADWMVAKGIHNELDLMCSNEFGVPPLTDLCNYDPDDDAMKIKFILNIQPDGVFAPVILMTSTNHSSDID